MALEISTMLETAATPLTQSRHRRILEILTRQPEVSVTALAGEFNVSTETIRRDLKQLEHGGQVRRVHGGAVSVQASPLLPIAERLMVESEAKTAIARAALPLVSEGMSVFLATSSTTLVYARMLAERAPIDVVTSMIDIALLFGTHENHTVNLTGGTYQRSTNSLTGDEQVAAIESRVFDLAFIGASAIDTKLGLLGPTSRHRRFSRALRSHARRLALLADSTKFNRSDHYTLLPWSEIDVLVTDLAPPPIPDACQKHGVELIVPA
jgi:DeoR/GlpR family transcriptional regulator of sugar metabolism